MRGWGVCDRSKYVYTYTECHFLDWFFVSFLLSSLSPSFDGPDHGPFRFLHTVPLMFSLADRGREIS